MQEDGSSVPESRDKLLIYCDSVPCLMCLWSLRALNGASSFLKKFGFGERRRTTRLMASNLNRGPLLDSMPAPCNGQTSLSGEPHPDTRESLFAACVLHSHRLEPSECQIEVGLGESSLSPGWSLAYVYQPTQHPLTISTPCVFKAATSAKQTQKKCHKGSLHHSNLCAVQHISVFQMGKRLTPATSLPSPRGACVHGQASAFCDPQNTGS